MHPRKHTKNWMQRNCVSPLVFCPPVGTEGRGEKTGCSELPWCNLARQKTWRGENRLLPCTGIEDLTSLLCTAHSR